MLATEADLAKLMQIYNEYFIVDDDNDGPVINQDLMLPFGLEELEGGDLGR